MLQPKRTKFRKAFKGRIHGDAKGGTAPARVREQLDDAAAQVRALVRETVVLKDPSAAARLEDDGTPLDISDDVQGVITAELVTFRSLSELCAQNKRLLHAVRELGERLERQEMRLEVSEPALAELARSGFDPVFGARPLKRAIQQQIENPVAKLILEGRFGPRDVVPVDWQDGQFVFTRTLQ